MKIQKGLVKYKDRNDIVCTYGITDDGRQLYFLNDSKLSNDNVIITTTLVEAIDPSVVHSHVGVANQDGTEIIPCTNKSIKLITKDLLLVEPSEAISSSVKEANNNKKDPVEAQKLVNASATIKDNIFKTMGSDGRFIFNDLFSEATLYDLNGNNLVDGRYYSFIAINKKGDTMYLSSNSPEGNVDSFSLLNNKLNDSVVVNQDITVPDVETPPVDVSQVEVEQTSIENAMDNGVQEVDSISDTPVDVAVPVPEAPPVEASVPAPEAAPVENAFEASIPVPDVPNQEELVEEVSEPATEENAFDASIPVPEVPNQEELVEDKPEPVEEVESVIEDVEVPQEEAEPVTETEEEPVEEEVETIEEETPDEEFEPLTLPDAPINYSTDIKKIEDDYSSDGFDDLLNSSNGSYRSSYRRDSNIMEQAANTISRLIDVNANQRSELSNYKDQVRELTTLNKKVVDKARRDLDRVQSSISSKDNEIDLLKSRLQDMESQLRDKERRLNSQEDELSNLRSQIEGKSDLQKVLEDADSYLGGE